MEKKVKCCAKKVKKSFLKEVKLLGKIKLNNINKI